jgi:hypothetical protein
MEWNILNPYEKVLIINLLPQVRTRYKYIEPRNLFTPEPGNHTIHSALFGDYNDFMFTFGKIGLCKSQKLKGIRAWEAIEQFKDDLLIGDEEYTSVNKRLIAIWCIESISLFYIEIAKLYYFQDSYSDKKELARMVNLILDYVHGELAKFEVDPNSKSILSYMDITRTYSTNPSTTVDQYDKILDICEQYATDWFNIYPFAPRPDKK